MLIRGTNASEQLYGTAGNDTITGLAGDDYLAGAEGRDLYVFSPGSGLDTIQEFTTGADGGRLRFVGGITPDDVRFVRPVGDPFTLIVEAGSDRVTLANFFDSNGLHAGRFDRVEFGTGDPDIDLTGSDFPFVGTDGYEEFYGTTLADVFIGSPGGDYFEGRAGRDTYVFSPGFDGASIVEDTGVNGGRLRFVGGITPDDVRFVRPVGDPFTLIVEAGSDRVTLNNFFDNYGVNAGRFGRVEFGTGDPDIDLTGSDFPFVGTDGYDELYGTGQDETIVGLGGDDYLSGGTGFDLYVFAPGFGHDSLIESINANGGRIRMEGGIAPTDVTFNRPTDDTRTLVVVVGSDSIAIQDFFQATVKSPGGSIVSNSKPVALMIWVSRGNLSQKVS